MAFFRNVNFSGKAPALNMEGLLLPLRWATILFVAVGVFLADPSVPVIALVLLAALYNLTMVVLVKRKLVGPSVNLVSPAVNGFLAVAGLLATGGLTSPYQPVLTLILLAIALRLPKACAIGLGLLLILSFSVGQVIFFGLTPPHSPQPLLVFVLFDFLAVLMVAAAVSRHRKMQMQFLQTMAHELRNPMAGVKGILSLLRRRAPKGVTLAESLSLLETMEEQVDRLTLLLQELLQADDARRGELKFNWALHDLREIISIAVESSRAEFPNRCITSSFPDRTIPVRCDAEKVKAVVTNLVENAIQYSEPTSTVTVNLSVMGKWCLLQVCDEGRGIPKNKIGGIFEGFYRVSSTPGTDPGGLGLSLYISKEIIRQHGGFLAVSSQEGHGSTFVAHIPLYDEPRSTAAS